MQDFSRCAALNNIPSKKLQEALSVIQNDTSLSLADRTTKLLVVNRISESNIPIEYWGLKMERDFVGDPGLKTAYNDYVADLKTTYINGKSLCFAGQHGVGKTISATCILKRAALKGFSCLYTDMSSVVAILTQAPYEDRYLARQELNMVDFLVIDEIDIRFYGASDASNELFGKSLENIFRTRRQNKLPTIICTNSPNLTESFTGALKQSLGSLFSDRLTTVFAFGNDYRKAGENQ